MAACLDWLVMDIDADFGSGVTLQSTKQISPTAVLSNLHLQVIKQRLWQ